VPLGLLDSRRGTGNGQAVPHSRGQLVFAATGLTLLRLLLLHLAAGLLPLSGRPWISNLRGAVVNLIALTLPLAVIIRR